MQQVWLALIGGLILGWLIEWIVDWQFWRRNLDELRTENQTLRRQLADSQAQLAALQPAPAAPIAAAGETVDASAGISPEAPAVMPVVEPDPAHEEANSHGVTTAPADPQAEGE